MIESTIKIIIIDDEPAILDLSKQFLELNQDISADVASSAAEALELIKTQNYDTIVSDYQMPGKDGIQLLKEIRGTGNKIAFILFTGKGREDVAIEALNAGADFYLQKGGNPRAQFAELKNMIIKSVEKHRIELDLKDEEEKFKDIFNSANDSIHILDLDGRILEINDIGCKWLGYTKQEMLQKNVKEIDLEVYALQVPARIKEVMKKGFALFETEWMTKSGRIIPVEVSARSIDYAGRSAILSVVRDVTERKRNQEALAAIRNLLSETERIGKIGGWSFDVETLVQTWTDETFRILEIDLNEGEPKVPEGLSFIAPDFRPIAEQAMQRAIQFGEPYDQEWEIITMKGNRRWIHTVGTIHQENGKTRRVTGTFQDITERKRAEEELIQSEERFSKAFNSSPIGISIQRLADGFQIDVNETILQMFEFCRQEVIGHTTFELNIFTCQNQHEEYTHLLQEQGSIHNLEATFRTKTGKLINTIMSIDKLSIPGQDLVLTTLEDITDRKKAEEALRRSEENFRLLTASMSFKMPKWHM